LYAYAQPQVHGPLRQTVPAAGEDAADTDEEPGTEVEVDYEKRLHEQVQETKQKLRRIARRQLSETDPDTGLCAGRVAMC
jgi:hypothetical protein